MALTWVNELSIMGPQGPQGAVGATGPQGAAGAAGATGPTGPAGADGQDSVTTRYNLDPNPTALVDVAGMTGSGAFPAPTRSTGTAYSSPASASWTANASGTGVANMAPATGIRAGQVYTASRYVRVSTARTVTPSLVFTDASGTVLSTIPGAPVAMASGVWTRMQVTDTAPAGADRAYLSLSVAAVVSGNILFTDDGMVEAAPAARTYFDGSYAGATWLSAAGNSPSSTPEDFNLYLPKVARTTAEVLYTVATYADVPGLSFPVLAGAEYILDGLLSYNARAISDIKFCMTGPTGTTFDFGTFGAITSLAAASATDTAAAIESYMQTTFDGVGRAVGGNGNVDMGATPRGWFLIGSTAGTLQLQGAQFTADATASRLRRGSWLRLQRIA
jgi:hypothetical protein